MIHPASSADTCSRKICPLSACFNLRLPLYEVLGSSAPIHAPPFSLSPMGIAPGASSRSPRFLAASSSIVRHLLRFASSSPPGAGPKPQPKENHQRVTKRGAASFSRTPVFHFLHLNDRISLMSSIAIMGFTQNNGFEYFDDCILHLGAHEKKLIKKTRHREDAGGQKYTYL